MSPVVLPLQWVRVGHVCSHRIASPFIEADDNACVMFVDGCDYGFQKNWEWVIGKCMGHPCYETWLTDLSFHWLVMAVLGISVGYKARPLGLSLQCCSIFLESIRKPVLQSPIRIRYVLVNGHFFDGNSYHRQLYCDETSRRLNTGSKGISDPFQLRPSDLRVHSSLLMMTRSTVDGLELCMRIQSGAKVVALNFLMLHLATLGLSTTSPCQHNWRDPLSDSFKVITTSVEAPRSTNSQYLAVTLTHLNPEARFLCGTQGVHGLLHECCLNCGVEEARQGGYGILISW